MKYEPEQGGGFDSKSEEFVRLYLFENSSLNTFARLVLTPAQNPADAHLIWERAGSSKRYIKYDAIQNEHMPARWGWNDRVINKLYIPKANPINSLTEDDGDLLYLVANYGGAVKQKPEVITEIPNNSEPEAGYPEWTEKPLKKSNEELSIRKVLLDATKLAKAAAEAQMKKLEAAGPKYAVKDSFTGITHGTMLDSCGGAWIAGVDGRSKLGKIWKKLAQNSQSGFFFGDKRHCGIHVTKSQYVSVREAAAKAFVSHVNAELGTELYVWTYLD
jgi:hypothetical protein